MILVVGGTGRLGRALIERRARNDEAIRVMTRDTAGVAPFGRAVETVAGDVRRPATLGPALEGVRLVVAAAHGFAGPRGTSPQTVDADGNANLLRAAEAAGAEVVLLSVVGAAADHPMELFRMKAVAERSAAEARVPTTVVRASAFGDLWLDLLSETARRSSRPVVFGRGRNPINFVAVADVAALVDAVIDDGGARGATLEIGGSRSLTFDELAALLASSIATLGPPRHVPTVALKAMASTVGRLRPELGRQARAALAMDHLDMTAPKDGGSARERYPDLPYTTIEDVARGSAALRS